jgi:hypothetical protein
MQPVRKIIYGIRRESRKFNRLKKRNPRPGRWHVFIKASLINYLEHEKSYFFGHHFYSTVNDGLR